MEKAKTILSSDTLVPIGVLGLVFGACVWLTTMYSQGVVNAAQIVEIKADHEKSVDKIHEKLTKIEDKLDLIMEKLKK
jgi:hypothetical protein